MHVNFDISIAYIYHGQTKLLHETHAKLRVGMILLKVCSGGDEQDEVARKMHDSRRLSCGRCRAT